MEKYLSDVVGITEIYGDRMTGTDGSKHTAVYLYNSFHNMSKRLQIYTSNWNYFGDFCNPRFFQDKNILAKLPGLLPNASTIVFLVHFDTIEGSLGADDDGSGVAALLSIAEVLSQYEFNHTIIFCASSGEEVGDLGDYHEAKTFYEEDQDVFLAITADAIGYMPQGINSDRKNSVVVYKPERSSNLALSIETIFGKYDSQIGLDSIRFGKYFGHSGNRAYDDYGFATVKFFEGVTNPGWELPPHNNDSIEFVNISYLTSVTKLIASYIGYLADLPDITLDISIDTPREDTIYCNNEVLSLIPLTKGKTLCLGPCMVKSTVNATNQNITKVFFELITGRNELPDGDYNRMIVTNHTDNTPPYQWDLKTKFIGWHTIRSTVYTANGISSCDDIEVFFF